MTKHKHYDAAYAAFYNFSFTPDKRAEDYCAGFDSAIAELEILSVDPEKIAKYEKLWLDWMHKKSRCLSSMITGPANFPVARNQKAMEAERRAGDLCCGYYEKLIKDAKQADYYDAHPEAKPINSADDDAIERLKEKLASLEEKQAEMKAHNAKCRKEKSGQCYQPFDLTNNNAKIKNTAARIKELEKRQEQGTQEIIINGVRVVQNPDAHRLQLFFNGKPSPEIIAALKSKAFKWSPNNGCWQRQLTNSAIYAFEAFIKPVIESDAA